MFLCSMEALYIFTILIAIGNANSSTEFDTTNGSCLDVPDFCTCARFWVNCDCQNHIKTTGNLLGSKRFIRIRNCQQLIVSQGSFRSVPLTVIFQDIKNLSLSNGSFEIDNNARINITILNSKSSEIPSHVFRVSRPGQRDPRDPVQPSALAGATPTLVLSVADSEIRRIASGVLANFTLHEVSITNTTIGQVDTEAINSQVKKTISFINNTFTSLDTRAVVFRSSMRNVELVLQRNTFKGIAPQFLVGSIKGNAYILNNSFPKLEASPWQLRVEGDITLLGNQFLLLPRHGLDITVRNHISFVENTISHLGPEAFLHIKPEGKKTIFFMEDNLIGQLEPMSLCLNEAFKPNSVVIKHIRFQQKCACNITSLLDQALGIKNLTLEEIYNNEVHEQWFKNGECKLEPQGISHISIDQFLIHSCLPHNYYTMEILLSFALILATIAVCIILGWRRMRRTASTSSPAGYHSYTEPLPPSTVPGSWLVVQPEPRTYQETEIHVLFDKAQEIKENDDVDTNENEEDIDKVSEMKRTPSPSTRQSCPVLPSPHE